MFMKRCILYDQSPEGSWDFVMEGDVQVYYDPELYASRIAANDDSGAVLSNTLIGLNTQMDVSTNILFIYLFSDAQIPHFTSITVKNRKSKYSEITVISEAVLQNRLLET